MLSSSLETRFSDELAILKRLFGTTSINLTRINLVYDYTEQKWREYIDQIPDGVIKYLLIAEAPPATADGPPPYFLDPAARPRTLMQAVSGAFFGDLVYKQLGSERTLAKLAQQGFLMVDSIPFAMDYKARRSRKAYADLVALTAKKYMLAKLAASSLSWSRDLRIAFSVPKNAHRVMRGLQRRLKVGEMSLTLSEDMIAVDRSNYPRADVLRAVFRL